MTDNGNGNRRYHAHLYWLQSAARRVFVGNRVSACCRVRVPKKKVEIWGNIEERRAKYRNVVRCASVWVCPVCANNITAHRRNEIETVNSVFSEMAIPVMVSFTLSHQRQDSLVDTLTTLTGAWRDMTSRRSWKSLNGKAWNGYVRSTEITWSPRNGWHPHLHLLFWVKPETCIAGMYADIRDRWGKAVTAAGGTSRWERATYLTVADESIAAYIAKWGHDPKPETRERLTNWGMAAEATRGILSKKGSNGGLTPFDMLELFLLNGNPGPGPGYWGKLLREYAEATSGQRQISWSRNPDMRQLAGIKKDKSDAEVVEGEDAGYVLLATLSDEDWTGILWSGSEGVILDCAARGDEAMMRAVIEDCKTEHLKAIGAKA